MACVARSRPLGLAPDCGGLAPDFWGLAPDFWGSLPTFGGSLPTVGVSLPTLRGPLLAFGPQFLVQAGVGIVQAEYQYYLQNHYKS